MAVAAKAVVVVKTVIKVVVRLHTSVLPVAVGTKHPAVIYHQAVVKAVVVVVLDVASAVRNSRAVAGIAQEEVVVGNLVAIPSPATVGIARAVPRMNRNLVAIPSQAAVGIARVVPRMNQNLVAIPSQAAAETQKKM